MSVNIGIPDDNRQKVVAILNTLLADEFLLYTKTRNFHWNVTGPQFNDLHKFFESLYEALDEVVDEVAERARALDGRALGTLEEFRTKARLGEKPGAVPAARDMLATLWPTTRPSFARSARTSTPSPTGSRTSGPPTSSPGCSRSTRRRPGC